MNALFVSILTNCVCWFWRIHSKNCMKSKWTMSKTPWWDCSFEPSPYDNLDCPYRLLGKAQMDSNPAYRSANVKKDCPTRRSLNIDLDVHQHQMDTGAYMRWFGPGNTNEQVVIFSASDRSLYLVTTDTVWRLARGRRALHPLGRYPGEGRGRGVKVTWSRWRIQV